MQCGIAVDLPPATRRAPQIAGRSKACHRGIHTTAAPCLPPLKTHIVLALPHQAARVLSRSHPVLAFHIPAARSYRPSLTPHLRYHRLHPVCGSRMLMPWRPIFAGIGVGVAPRTSRRQNQLSLRRQQHFVMHRCPLGHLCMGIILLRCPM